MRIATKLAAGAALCAALATLAANKAAAVDSDASFVPHLSPREREVLTLWASGETAKGVAEMLHLSVNTVNVYLRRVKEKYEAVGHPARTKSELRTAAQQAGLVPKTWWERTITQHRGRSD